MKTQEIRTIRGYVQSVPRAAGKEDSTKAALVTEDGAVYYILHKGAGMDLVDYVSADVEVTGSVSERPKPEAGEVDKDATGEGEPAFLLTVRSYRLTDGYDNPWYDDDA